MERFDYAADINYPGTQPRRINHERRPAAPDTPQMPITISALAGASAAIAAASTVMLLQAERRWLWIALLVGAAVFLLALIWRLQVLDNMSVIERETTIVQPGADIRPTVTEGVRGNVIRRGNFTMRREYWERLYKLAQDGRRVTRDAVVAEDAMPRELYHAVFDETTAEMRRVGLLDNDNRMTAAWREFHRDTVVRSPVVRPVAVRSSVNGAGVGGSE